MDEIVELRETGLPHSYQTRMENRKDLVSTISKTTFKEWRRTERSFSCSACSIEWHFDAATACSQGHFRAVASVRSISVSPPKIDHNWNSISKSKIAKSVPKSILCWYQYSCTSWRKYYWIRDVPNSVHNRKSKHKSTEYLKKQKLNEHLRRPAFTWSRRLVSLGLIPGNLKKNYEK